MISPSNTHPPIGARLAKAMAIIPEIPKTGNHPKYGPYATADDIYSAVNKALSDQELFVTINEEKFKFWTEKEDLGEGFKPKVTRWVRVQFQVSLCAAYCEERISEHITLVHQYFHPQTTQALRTFAVKYFLRSIFLLPTGDVREDEEALDTLPVPTRKTTKKQTKPTSQDDRIMEHLID